MSQLVTTILPLIFTTIIIILFVIFFFTKSQPENFDTVPCQGSHPACRVGSVSAGTFDYYTLAMSFAPTFCQQNPSKSSSSECSGTNSSGNSYRWVLHGLWPEGGTCYPQNCPTNSYTHEQLINILNSSVPDWGDIGPEYDALIDHEWNIHGTCSGLSPQDYFTLAFGLARNLIQQEASGQVDLSSYESSGSYNICVPKNVTPDSVVDTCSNYNNDCASCVSQSSCGMCKSDGTCWSGTSIGPNNNHCSSTDWTQDCSCPTGNTGQTCSGNGSCNNGTCSCGAGWTGNDCSVQLCPTGINGQTCSGNGSCNNGTCSCGAGWTGNDCSVQLCPTGINGQTCSGNGSCNNGTCLCNSGWSGNDCSIPQTDPCSQYNNDCNNCTNQQACGYCANTGDCLTGNNSAPINGECSGSDWTWDQSQCS